MKGAKQIPLLLIYSRLLFGFIILGFAFVDLEYRPQLICSLIIAGFISDIFDGIIARRLNISSVHLRSLDSNVDLFFWMMILLSAVIIRFDFFKDYWPGVIILLIMETIPYLVSFFKFKKPVSTHTLFSKAWTICLLLFFISIFYSGGSVGLFYICIYSGILSRLEILLIMILLNQWESDVPSIFAVRALNAGKKIKRYKLFNG